LIRIIRDYLNFLLIKNNNYFDSYCFSFPND
jgi:hypothetical protein